MIGKGTPVAAASTSKTMKDLVGPLQLLPIQEPQFPPNAKLAYKYLHPVLAISASSERIFPEAGNTSETQLLDLLKDQVTRVSTYVREIRPVVTRIKCRNRPVSVKLQNYAYRKC